MNYPSSSYSLASFQTCQLFSPFRDSRFEFRDAVNISTFQERPQIHIKIKLIKFIGVLVY
jgi:hypothetical protein